MLLTPTMIARIREQVEESESLLWEEFDVTNLSEYFKLQLRSRASVYVKVTEQPALTRSTRAIVAEAFETAPRPSVPTTFRLVVTRAPHPSGAADGTDSVESEGELLSLTQAWIYTIPDHLRAVTRADAQAERDRQVQALLEPWEVPDEPFSKEELGSLHATIETLRARLEALIDQSFADKRDAKKAISDLRTRLQKLEASASRVGKAAFFRYLAAILLGLSPALDGLRQLDQFVREIGLLPPR